MDQQTSNNQRDDESDPDCSNNDRTSRRQTPGFRKEQREIHLHTDREFHHLANRLGIYVGMDVSNLDYW